MEPFVLAIVLGSALFHAAWNIIIKGGSNAFFETVMKTSAGGVIVAVILPFLPPPQPESWPYLALTACIHVAYYTSMAYAYSASDLSYAYTIMRGSSPLFTAVVAVFFMRDALSGGGWAGVGLLSAGILLLTLDSIKRGQFNLRATLTALCTAAVIMAYTYTVVDGAGVRLSGNSLSYVCWVFFLNAFPVLCIALCTRPKAYFTYLRGRWRYGLCGGFCSLVAYGLSLWAMTRAPIPLVAALRESSVVFGMLLSVLFLSETMTPARVGAVFLVLGGAVAIKLYG